MRYYLISMVAAWSLWSVQAKADGNFYAGLGLGMLNLKANMNVSSKDGVVTDGASRHIDNAAMGFQGSLGYEKVLHGDYFIGMEGVYIHHNSSATMRNCFASRFGAFEVKDTISMKHTYGLNISVGRQFDAISPYLKLGIMSTRFDVVATTPPGGRNIDGKDSKRQFGFAPGVGLKYAVSDRVDLVTEGTFAFYNSFKTKNFDRDGGDMHSVKVSPWFFMFMIGLRFRF